RRIQSVEPRQRRERRQHDRQRATGSAMELLAALALGLSLSVPDRASATPTIAVDGALVAVAWSARSPAGVTDIYAAVSRDGARTFGPPVRVSDADSAGWINGEQPPRAVLARSGAGDPAITIVWPSKSARGIRIVSARSTDGGRTFSTPASIPEGDAA